jgi:hypothetical protein
LLPGLQTRHLALIRQLSALAMWRLAMSRLLSAADQAQLVPSLWHWGEQTPHQEAGQLRSALRALVQRLHRLQLAAVLIRI